MTASFNSLSALLVAKVKSSNLVDPASVYNYEPSGEIGYPVITVTPLEMSSDFADTVRNEIHYHFSVKVRQERIETGQGPAEQLMIQIVDTFQTLFDTDLTLGGQIIGLGYMRPLAVKWSYVQGPQIVERMADVTVEIVVIQ
jgi:hypothetical protein